jgi:hypothetical protein
MYTEYKTLKFTAHKFYRHVLMGERNWLLEEIKNTYHDANYDYSDSLLGNEYIYSKSKVLNKMPIIKRDWQPSFKGAYGENTKTNV